MKKLFIATLFVVLCLGFSQAQESKSKKLQLLLKGKVELNTDKLSSAIPIADFNAFASEKADKVIELEKSNIKEALVAAKEFSTCVITVGKHTIVLVVDLNDCKPSGAWGACMPKGKGLIQKGEMNEREGYINNIIGIPDGQTRKMFLFK
ncbi:hypothetical protein EMN47_04435 [Prolixibacteraceae bacterium JC049]|nr:hypothetical protein [Prolixibacteraceae bacterium JC049]